MDWFGRIEERVHGIGYLQRPGAAAPFEVGISRITVLDRVRTDGQRIGTERRAEVAITVNDAAAAGERPVGSKERDCDALTRRQSGRVGIERARQGYLWRADNDSRRGQIAECRHRLVDSQG